MRIGNETVFRQVRWARFIVSGFLLGSLVWSSVLTILGALSPETPSLSPVLFLAIGSVGGALLGILVYTPRSEEAVNSGD